MSDFFPIISSQALFFERSSKRVVTIWVPIANVETLDFLKDFEHPWQYLPKEHAHALEWGRIVTDKFIFKFLTMPNLDEPGE